MLQRVEDRLVIVTSNHGTEFPGGKKTLRDQGTQIMLLIRGPKGISTPFTGGQVNEPMVAHLDLYPTICDILGKKAEHKLEGKSLVPLASKEVESLHEVTFAQQTYHGPLEPLRSVRSERYKYIRRHLPAGPQMRHDEPATPPMETAGWYDQDVGTEELFDLYLDPMEACNRAHDPAYAEIKAELSTELNAWMIETNDPFPTSEFPPTPSGQL